MAAALYKGFMSKFKCVCVLRCFTILAALLMGDFEFMKVMMKRKRVHFVSGFFHCPAF